MTAACAGDKTMPFAAYPSATSIAIISVNPTANINIFVHYWHHLICRIEKGNRAAGVDILFKDNYNCYYQVLPDMDSKKEVLP